MLNLNYSRWLKIVWIFDVIYHHPWEISGFYYAKMQITILSLLSLCGCWTFWESVMNQIVICLLNNSLVSFCKLFYAIRKSRMYVSSMYCKHRVGILVSPVFANPFIYHIFELLVACKACNLWILNQNCTRLSTTSHTPLLTCCVVFCVVCTHQNILARLLRILNSSLCVCLRASNCCWRCSKAG